LSKSASPQGYTIRRGSVVATSPNVSHMLDVTWMMIQKHANKIIGKPMQPTLPRFHAHDASMGLVDLLTF